MHIAPVRHCSRPVIVSRWCSHPSFRIAEILRGRDLTLIGVLTTDDQDGSEAQQYRGASFVEVHEPAAAAHEGPGPLDGEARCGTLVAGTQAQARARRCCEIPTSRGI